MAILIPKHRHFIDGARIFYDTETTGKYAWKGDRPFAFSFYNEAGDSKTFEFEVDPLTRKPTIVPKILESVKRLMEDDTVAKAGFNEPFDAAMLSIPHGITVRGRRDDVMWMSQICNSAEHKHALKPLADKYTKNLTGELRLDTDDEEELGIAVKACRLQVRKLGWKIAKEETGEGKDDKVYKADYWLPAAVSRLAPPEVRRPLLARFPRLSTLANVYATKDSLRTMLLFFMFCNVMDEENLWEVYEREIRMAPVTQRSERVGMRIFPERCDLLGRECQTRMRDLRIELSRIFGDFNAEVPGSRIAKFMHSPKPDGLGLPVLSRTEKTHDPSTNKQTLEWMIPLVDAVTGEDKNPLRKNLEFDRHNKVWNHYIRKFQSHAVADGSGQLIIHTNFRQIGATTGRMSISGIPLHQIPKRAKEGDIMKRARYPLGPRKGCVWIHNDFKSIEPRILAEEADEKDILRVFNDGEICNSVEGGWTHDPYEILVDRVAFATKKTREYLDGLFEARGGARQVCKINFLGWTYGEGIRALAGQMGCSYDEAAQIIHALQTAFGGVGPFMQQMQRIAERDGFIRNRYGRKCMIPRPARIWDGESEAWVWVKFWYKATNYLIQGTAADMLKEAAIRLGGEARYYDRGGTRHECSGGYLKGSGAEILLYIHDEVITEVPIKLAVGNEKFVRGIGDCMADNQGRFTKVATPVDTKVTWNSWSDPEPVETLWGASKEQPQLVEA
jgi:DNA polymerase I-like protein with 3'-5' exonuclease and polymerase domains